MTCREHKLPYTWRPLARGFQSGDGCPKCYGFNKTLSDFIDQANKLHKFKYKYDKAIYRRSDLPITITCPKHGDWHTTTPNGHLSPNKPRGCPECGKQLRLEKVTKSTEQFIKDAKNVHGPERYDYSDAIYVNSNTHVYIKCPRLNHGKFLQTPQIHLQGKGCYKCGYLSKSWDSLEDIFEPNRVQNFEPCDLYIYELKRFSGYYKIGIATDKEKRKDGEYSDHPVLILKLETRQKARLLELDLLSQTISHKRCPKKLYTKKWAGYTEVRYMNREDLIMLAQRLRDEIDEMGPKSYAACKLDYVR